MGLRRPRRIGLTLALAVLAVCFAVPASASAARILYADGHPLDPTRLATFGGHTAVDPPGVDGFDGCSDAEWAMALARTDFDILMVGEDAPDCFTTDLEASTLAAIANYVRNGKPIIITGAHADEAGFLNAVFGFNTTNVLDSSDEDITAEIQSAASGTPFAGGPPNLHANSATEALSGTPGTTIYAGTSPPGTWVFTVPFGAGTVTFLGWDFCCGTDAFQDDWYRVLDRATKVSSAFTIVSITRNKKKGTATITGDVQFPGELIASGKGVKSSSAGGAVISKAVGAGQAKLVVKAKGKKRKKLNQKGKAKVKVTVTYTATAGSPKTQSVKVKLKKKLKKK
jgi:hypothetical protein